MKKRVINPWRWQDAFGFVQANEIGEVSQVLVCSGQTALNAEAQVTHEGDMRGQVAAALDNLETVLSEAGYTLADVVNLTVYTTDMNAYLEAHEIVVARTGEAGCQTAMTFLGISQLAIPGLLVEIEALAAR